MIKLTDTNKKIGAAVLSLSALTAVGERYSGTISGNDNLSTQSSSEIISDARKEIESLANTSHDIREEALKLQDQYRDLRLRLERLKMVETALDTVIASGESAAAAAKTEITDLRDRMRNANEKLDKLGTEVQEIIEENEGGLSQINKQRKKIKNLNEELEGLEKELASRGAVHKKKDSLMTKIEKALRKPF